METMCATGACPFSQISWLWYAVSVVATFLFGWLWFGVLFTKQWAEATRFECPCGANLTKGEQCCCKPNASAAFTFGMQLVATALLGLMYFVLTGVSIWLSVIVVVAVSGWMKTSSKFEIPDFKRWVKYCFVNVGYFFLISVIFILFSLIK